MENSIYWYDYETFGINPQLDRIAQFGGIRTDEKLNIISDPLVIYCQPADDCIPDPTACLITGITPQKALAEGMCEAEFIATIHQEFSKPGTCIAGYNSIRFDDEFTRNTLYRNFFNAYEHEWQHNNSRWDIIDTVRLTRALRPEGINWPQLNEQPSIKLELLTQANNIQHEAAHDAMSDVYATIELAKLIKQKQPKLYHYAYQLRRKNEVLNHINLQTHEAILHASSRYSTQNGATAIVMPICQHPKNKNGYIVYDLQVNPEQFLAADVDELRARLYTRKAELPEGVLRVPLKQIHINKCPIIAPLKTLDDASAQRLNINLTLCQQHRQVLLDNMALFRQKTIAVFEDSDFPKSDDPDTQLYAGGFFSRDDSQRINQVRHCKPKQLSHLTLNFDDPRLATLLFRYRARNYPEFLNSAELEDWNQYRQQKFNLPEKSHRTLNQFFAQIEQLRQQEDITGSQLALLDDLCDYVEKIKI